MQISRHAGEAAVISGSICENKTYSNSGPIAACAPLDQNYLKIVIEGHGCCHNPNQRGDTLQGQEQHWDLRATQHIIHLQNTGSFQELTTHMSYSFLPDTIPN